MIAANSVVATNSGICPAWGCGTPKRFMGPPIRNVGCVDPAQCTTVTYSDTSLVPNTSPVPSTGVTTPQVGVNAPPAHNPLAYPLNPSDTGSTGTVADAASGGAAMSGISDMFNSVGSALNNLIHPGTDGTATTTTQPAGNSMMTWVILFIAAWIFWRAL